MEHLKDPMVGIPRVVGAGAQKVVAQIGKKNQPKNRQITLRITQEATNFGKRTITGTILGTMPTKETIRGITMGTIEVTIMGTIMGTIWLAIGEGTI